MADDLQKKKKNLFNSGSLAKKTASAIGVLVVVCMIALVAISVGLSSNFLSNSINDEFIGLAEKNGQMVQSVVDVAANTASNIQAYIEDAYKIQDQNGYTGETEKSALYDIQLQRINKQVEDFILYNAWSSVSSGSAITGMGVFFEPNAFDPAKTDYTIYVSESDAAKKSCQSYGSYSEYSTQSYYTEAKNTKNTVFTDPYEEQGVTMVTASWPILYNNTVKGVIMVDINVEQFSILDSEQENFKSLYVDVLTNDGVIIYDSESTNYLGENLRSLISTSDYKKIQSGLDTGKAFNVTTKKDTGSKVVRYYSPITVESQTWWAASALNRTDLYSNTYLLLVLMIVNSIVAVIVIVYFTMRLLRKYIKPIDVVVEASTQLKNGDFDITIEAESDDEIGLLADAFSEAAATLRSVIKDMKAVLKDMAENNFQISPNTEYPGEFAEIKTSLFSVVTDISKTLTEINGVSEQVSANADNISQGAQSITEGATDQSSAVEELQATITNVSEEVSRNADVAKAANEVAKSVGNNLISSTDNMKKVVDAMEVINESSTQISSIIGTINDIASQTNLLALNASIEAARAGEAGKGFAVVATQVGTLATQSAEAAKNSTELIANTIDAVDNGKRIVDAASNQLAESADNTNKLVSDIAEISEASATQAEALEQILQAADQIAAVVEENTAMAQESSASSEELAAQAQRLKELIEVFRLYEG